MALGDILIVVVGLVFLLVYLWVDVHTRRYGIDAHTKNTRLRRPAHSSYLGRGSLCVSNL